MEENFSSLLDGYNAEVLNSLARFHNVTPKEGKGKQAVIRALDQALTEQRHVLATYKSLTQAEKALVDLILQQEGPVPVRTLRSLMVKAGWVDPNERVEYFSYSQKRPDPQAQNSKRLEDLLARLTLKGLVFNALDPASIPYSNKLDYFSPIYEVFIPEPVRRHLPPVAPPARPEIRPVTVERSREGSARVFQRDLYLYWSYLRDHSPSLTQKGELVKKALKEINTQLLERVELEIGKGENDYPRLRFLRQMINGLNLARFSRDDQIQAEGAPDFFALPAQERVRITYETWLKTGAFNELVMLPEGSRPRSGQSLLFPAPKALVRARQLVVQRFIELKPEGWFPLSPLVEEINEQAYDFLLPRPRVTSPYYYGLSNPYHGDNNPFGLTFPVSREEQGWGLVEARFIRDVFAGPLHWMGLVDLGWEEHAPVVRADLLGLGDKGAPHACRLTALGEWLLGFGPLPEIPSEGGRVLVQPNLQIIALDPIQDAVLLALDRFAERLTAERAVEYRLTRQSVYAGQQSGWEADRIKDFLREHTGQELPANVSRTLDDWQAQYERIRIRPGLALAHGLPEALDRLEQSPQGSAALVERPLPELAILTGAQAVPGLVRRMLAEETIPLFSVKGSVPQNAVAADEDGRLSFRVRFPSLYLHGHLAAFAEPVGEGYRITPETVARAAKAGLEAAEILQRLDAVLEGPLPEKLARRIRAWSHYYGDAALQRTVLLQVQDEETLYELLADPEIGPLLRRFKPSASKALAQVRDGDLERLRALLEERGVTVGEKLE